MKFHENILNGFQIIEGTQNYHCRILKGNNSKNVLTKVTVLYSARGLITLYISLKFNENVLDGFRVIEQTQNYRCRISKVNNSKTIYKRIMVLLFCTPSGDGLYFYERFSRYRADAKLPLSNFKGK